LRTHFYKASYVIILPWNFPIKPKPCAKYWFILENEGIKICEVGGLLLLLEMLNWAPPSIMHARWSVLVHTVRYKMCTSVPSSCIAIAVSVDCKYYELFEVFDLDCLILTIIRVLYMGTVELLMSCSRSVRHSTLL